MLTEMTKKLSWHNTVSNNKEKRDELTSALCSNEIYYSDLKTQSNLFTKSVTNLTVKTK